MRHIKKVLCIQSVGDLITNSSTEVFVFKSDEALREFFAESEFSKWKRCFDIFDTWEDLKEYLKDYPYFYDCYLTKLDDWPDSLSYINLGAIVKDMNGEKTIDEILDFFEPALRGLIGKAIFAYETDGWNGGRYLEEDLEKYNSTHPDNKIKSIESEYDG